jgi:site-specific recombinase XerD
METALVILEQPALPAELTATLELAADFAKASKAKATIEAYESDFRIFGAWCRERDLGELPAQAATVCAFLADQASLGRRASTLGRRLAAIRYFHRAAGYEAPTSDEKVKAVLSGIRRTIGAAPVRKAPVMPELAIAMTADSSSLRALRNRAVVLLGFASAMRRSEIVGLDVSDIEWRETGIVITIRESKTDKFKEGQQIGVVKGSVACPVAALRAWLDAAQISDGPLFRRVLNKRAQRVTGRRLAPRNVAAIVKAGVAGLGLDPRQYGGHSLRRGFVSAAVRAGKNVAKIAETTRHASLDMILVYQKSAELLAADNAGAGLL